MKKSLAHRQLLKQQLYSIKIVESKSIMEQLMKFNKILDDLANIEVKVKDEKKASQQSLQSSKIIYCRFSNKKCVIGILL